MQNSPGTVCSGSIHRLARQKDTTHRDFREIPGCNNRVETRCFLQGPWLLHKRVVLIPWVLQGSARPFFDALCHDFYTARHLGEARSKGLLPFLVTPLRAVYREVRWLVLFGLSLAMSLVPCAFFNKIQNRFTGFPVSM